MKATVISKPEVILVQLKRLMQNQEDRFQGLPSLLLWLQLLLLFTFSLPALPLLHRSTLRPRFVKFLKSKYVLALSKFPLDFLLGRKELPFYLLKYHANA